MSARLCPGLHALLVALALVFLALSFAATPARAQYFALGKGSAPLEPYDVDYGALADPSRRVTIEDRLHYVPLWLGAYATFDGELREQAWAQNDAAYALRAPIRNGYDLQRLIGSVAIRFDPYLSVFAQLGRFDSFARIGPSATDRDRGRVQQGFVELRERVGSADVTVRGGRQEVALGSGRFVWVNDSSNVRTTHDGVRAHADLGGVAALDLVYSRPVTAVLDAFGDFDSHAGAFAAAYLTETVLKDMHVDEYYFYRRNLGGQYSGLTGNEDRSTVGARMWGKAALPSGALLYDADGAYQFGKFDGREIAAFGGSARVLYSFDQRAWQPGLQFQTSYFSGGGGTTTHTIRTFSAPFPRPTLLNYVGINTLENLVEAYPALVVSPRDDLSFRFGPEFTWRADVNDAVYISRFTPLTATMAARDKASFIGTNLIATAQWRMSRDVSVFAEALHELPGPAILLAGGRTVDAGVIQVTFKF